MVVNPRLKTYLKLAYAGPGEKQQILNRLDAEMAQLVRQFITDALQAGDRNRCQLHVPYHKVL